MIDRDMLEAIGALDSGVLLPTCNIDQELTKMSPGEARKVKRKWRKLMRKSCKEYTWLALKKKKTVKRYVCQKLQLRGREILGLEENS
jgi:hypothetical protein